MSIEKIGMIGKKLVLSDGFKALIKETARKVFGNLPVVPYKTGMKKLRQKPLGGMLNNYYNKNTIKIFKKLDPTVEEEVRERRIAKLALLKKRGKGPPKKGQGKRAKKKKGK